jgi:putative membrane protein
MDVGEATVLGQRFGDDGLFVTTFAPAFADDVEYAVGLAASAEARVEGIDDVLLVDAHNCNNGLEGADLGHVVPGSKRSFDMMQAVGSAASELTGAEEFPIRLGTAWDRTPWRPEEGIGPLGVRVAAMEVGDQRTAYVLVDGNNMEPGLRDRIVESIEGVDEVEIMTTDTHLVNTVSSTNQVGGAIDEERLISLVDETVTEAIEDLEPVEAGMAAERAEVTVFGNDRTETLASQANAVISMGGALAAAVIIATMAVSLLVFILT